MPRSLRLRDERIEGGEVAVLVVDVEVVRDVVAVVLLGRRVARVQPDGVDAERLDVVEVLADPVEVADAVAGRVGERAHVHLVDERGLPPVRRAVHRTAHRTVMRTRDRSSAADAAITRS